MLFGDDNSYEQSYEHRRSAHRPETGNAFAASPSRLVNAYGDPRPTLWIGSPRLSGHCCCVACAVARQASRPRGLDPTGAPSPR